MCDCLLDQEVFLGVGNIIKNEALFLARIHPLTVMEAIPVPHLKDLALKAREFSMIFYRCVRQDARLGSYLTIYRKAVCPACAGTVLLKKMGMTKRMTSCCPSCQTLFV